MTRLLLAFAYRATAAKDFDGITPDLSTFAKGLGGGFPVAAMGGRRDIMTLVADGTVSMAGTYAANTIAVAAANAAMDELAEPGIYDRIFMVSDRLRLGLEKIMADAKMQTIVAGVGPVFQVWFTDTPIRNYRDAARHARHDLFRLWWEEMLERGILFHPGAYENLFISFAHTEADVDETLVAARDAVKALKRRTD